MSAEHERQHAIVADRKAKYDAVPKRRSGVNDLDRRKRGNEAWWALTWHMRRSHGVKSFFGRTYEQVETMHNQLHEEAS